MAEEAAKDVAEDKAIVPLALPPSQEEKDKPDDDSKAVAILETSTYICPCTFYVFFVCNFHFNFMFGLKKSSKVEYGKE